MPFSPQRDLTQQQYAAVLQEDDVEQHAHEHSAPSPAPTQPGESIAQTIASVFRPKPHVHCETCDAQTAARERRENEKHCCAMVGWVFIVLFICAMILGIAIVNSREKTIALA